MSRMTFQEWKRASRKRWFNDLGERMVNALVSWKRRKVTEARRLGKKIVVIPSASERTSFFSILFFLGNVRSVLVRENVYSLQSWGDSSDES